MPETEMKNRQEMANFMLNEDAHDTTNYDGMTLLPGACTAATRPLFSLFAAHNNIFKDVHISENSSKKGQKLSKKSFLMLIFRTKTTTCRATTTTHSQMHHWISWQQPLWLDQSLPIILSMEVSNQRMLVVKASAPLGKWEKGRPTPLYPIILLIWEPCLFLHFPTSSC